MGIDLHSLYFLLNSRRENVSFEDFAMIGRQRFGPIASGDLQRAFSEYAHSITAEAANDLLSAAYIEPLLVLLGANRIESVDYSSYEHATIVHDMNTPIPEALKSNFSCVFDGGCLEHVFHFPQSIKNCMEMVRVGGHFLTVTTANNFMGHGFYQFSPELYFRVLSDQNGFAIEDMFLCEITEGSVWYRILDPEQYGERVELVNDKPTFLMVRATRVKQLEIFATPPQQSDYVSTWSGEIAALDPGSRQQTLRQSLIQMVPGPIRIPLRAFRRKLVTNKWKRPFGSPAFRVYKYR